MTQPDKPVPARGARPQLFGEPSASRSSKSRQPDFGPSILATIDSHPRRDTRSSSATPLKRVLWMSGVALVVVLVYFAVKLGVMPSAPSVPAASVVAVQTPAPEPIVKPVEPAAVAPPPVAAAASASDGAATIENVAAAPAASAPEAATAKPNVAASLSNIQQVLARPDTTEPPKAGRPVVPKEPVAVAKADAVAKEDAASARAASPASKTPTKAANDGDADLLAAMLPHLKRRGTTPTSPAYEKRCGQLTGDAAVECRVKFCSGREGVDAACPSAVAR